MNVAKVQWGVQQGHIHTRVATDRGAANPAMFTNSDKTEWLVSGGLSLQRAWACNKTGICL
jgi:hypothetical protein